jgi:multiple RNA-binding domain-containing protein 1
LAETHLLNETREFLKTQGVNLGVFDAPKSTCKRSTTVIIVKNIPFTADEQDFHKLFAKHGAVHRVVMPPAKTLALVEMLEAAEARKAFRHLSYSSTYCNCLPCEPIPCCA